VNPFRAPVIALVLLLTYTAALDLKSVSINFINCGLTRVDPGIMAMDMLSGYADLRLLVDVGPPPFDFMDTEGIRVNKVE